MKTVLLLVLGVLVSGCCEQPDPIIQANTGIDQANRQLCIDFEELQTRDYQQLLPFVAPMKTGTKAYFDTKYVPVGFDSLWGATMLVTDQRDPHVGMILVYAPQTFHYENNTVAVGAVGRLPHDSPDWCQWFVADDVTTE